MFGPVYRPHRTLSLCSNFVARMVAGAGLDRMGPYRRVMPWLVAVGLFMEQLDQTIINTAVPQISSDLGTAALSQKSVLTT